VNFPSNALVPCTANLNEKPDIQSFIESGFLVHPCNRSIQGSFTFNPPSVRCNSLLTRKWKFTDSCGQVATFDQLVKLLPLQDPNKPKNGQINVDLWYELNWPQYPNSNLYRLYLWAFGEKRGDAIETSERYYRPYRKNEWYPPSTKMLWQIEYVLEDGVTINDVSIIPSPVWGFETRRVPDLKILSISAPSEVFTSRSVRVSWQVSNVGSGQNFQSHDWIDKVFISKSRDLDFGFLTKYRRQNRVLFAGDGYTDSAVLSIPKDLIGDFYVVVITDNDNRLIEVNRDNNKAWSINTMKIKLTPPPDLTVSNVVSPSLVFSG